MTTVMMHACAEPQPAGKIETAVTAMFSAIKEEKPEGIRYTAYRVGAAPTFVVLLEVQEGFENPLPAIAAVGRFQQDLRGGWLAEPPSMNQLAVVDEYRSF
jgi:hypothetical protein